MVPARRWVDKLRAYGDKAWRFRRPLAWGLALWVIVIALPCGLMFPDGGLHRPVTWLLALMPPLAMAVAAASGQPQLVLGMGLAGHLPILVACPDLLGPRVVGPVQGIAVAVLVLGFAAASFDSQPGGGGRVDAATRFRRLFRWPRVHHRRLLAALGVAWVAVAWMLVGEDGDAVEEERAARVAAAAICWMAVARVPIGVHGHSSTPESAGSLILRRGVWFGLGLAAWVWLNGGVK